MQKRVMERAHELRKELVGDYQAVMSLALKQAWEECRAKLEEMPTEVLESLKQEIERILRARKLEGTTKKVKVNFKEITREIEESGEKQDIYYNGGWVKEVKSVDQTKADGYCFEGDFVERSGLVDIVPGYFVICNISGSRKHQERRYFFVKVNLDGSFENLYEDAIIGRDWALQVRDEIAKLVN